MIHEAPAVLLCCLALLPREVLDIQNNLYQVGEGRGGLSLDTYPCPIPSSHIRLHILETVCGTLG